MTGAVQDTDWISAHAFYHGPLDPLIVDVVHPLAVDLAGAGLADRYFFLRYWDGGPHLRLRVLPADRDRAPEVARLVATRFDEYFRVHPSSSRMSAGDYRKTAALLAGLEGVGHEPAMRPNNSLSFIGYRRETHRYGTGASVRAVEQHFAESSEIAMGILRASPTPDQRVQAVYAMLLLAWFVVDPDPAEGGPRAPVPPGTLNVARRMRLLARHEGGPGSGALVSWARSVAVLRDVLTDLTGPGGPPVKGWDGPGDTRPARGEDGVLPVVDICAHLLCNRLGVTMDVEAAVRRTALRAIAALREEA